MRSRDAAQNPGYLCSLFKFSKIIIVAEAELELQGRYLRFCSIPTPIGESKYTIRRVKLYTQHSV